MSIINLLIIPECNYNPLLKFSDGRYIALTCSLNIHSFAKYITPEYCNFSPGLGFLHNLMLTQFCKIVYMPCVWCLNFISLVSIPEQRVQRGGCRCTNRLTIYGVINGIPCNSSEVCHFVHPALYNWCQWACRGNEHRRGLMIMFSCMSWLS